MPEQRSRSVDAFSKCNLERCRQRYGRSGGEIQIPAHKGSAILDDAGLPCECTTAILCDPGQHAIIRVEPFDLTANRNHFTRKLIAEHKRKLWPPDCAKLSLPELEIYRVQTRSVHLNENLVRPTAKWMSAD